MSDFLSVPWGDGLLDVAYGCFMFHPFPFNPTGRHRVVEGAFHSLQKEEKENVEFVDLVKGSPTNI